MSQKKTYKELLIVPICIIFWCFLGLEDNMGTEVEKNTFVFYRTYKEIDDKIMMTGVFWFLVSVVVIYVALVTKIGPDLMKNRKPFQLKEVLKYYNLFQVLLSTYITVLSVRALLEIGLMPKRTPQTNPEFRKLMAEGAVVVYLSKFTELFDTFFFVLRKKFNQISFLHVYHHASVIIGTWMYAKFGLSHTGIFGTFMNTSVHIVMYFYYFMAALGPKYHKYLTWKKYITSFQILQFASVFIHQSISLLYTKGEHSIVGILYLYFSAVMFFTLFVQFYLQNYTQLKSNKLSPNSTYNTYNKVL